MSNWINEQEVVNQHPSTPKGVRYHPDTSTSFTPDSLVEGGGGGGGGGGRAFYDPDKLHPKGWEGGEAPLEPEKR